MPDATRQRLRDAIYDHYKPESMEDSVPRTVEGAVLSIADKADTIAGMFALGLQPTGSKDPFALRRQANGIVKTIAEHKLPVSLSQLFKDARETYRGSAAEKKFAAAVDYERHRRSFPPRAPGVLSARCARLQVRRGECGAGGGRDDVVDAVARAEAVKSVLHCSNSTRFRLPSSGSGTS